MEPAPGCPAEGSPQALLGDAVGLGPEEQGQGPQEQGEEAILGGQEREGERVSYSSGSDGDGQEEEDVEEYFEPWELTVDQVHLAVFARETVDPARRIMTERAPPRLARKRASVAEPAAWSAPPPASHRPRKGSIAEAEPSLGLLAASAALARTQGSAGQPFCDREQQERDAAAEEEEEEDRGDSFCEAWDEHCLTATASTASLKGDQLLASAAYLLRVPEDCEGRSLWLWARVCLPEGSLPGQHALRVMLGEELVPGGAGALKWHGKWALKSSLCAAGRWHWQGYPLELRGLRKGRMGLRIAFRSLDVKLSALWLSEVKTKTPPQFEDVTLLPTALLHCAPNEKLATFAPDRPWTAHRVPDDATVRERVELYQRYIMADGEDAPRSFRLAAQSSGFAAAASKARGAKQLVAGAGRIFALDPNGELHINLPKPPESEEEEEDEEGRDLEEDDEVSVGEDGEEKDKDAAAAESDGDGDGDAPRARKLRRGLDLYTRKMWKSLFDDLVKLFQEEDRAEIIKVSNSERRLDQQTELLETMQQEMDLEEAVLRLIELRNRVAIECAQAAIDFQTSLIYGTLGGDMTRKDKDEQGRDEQASDSDDDDDQGDGAERDV